MSILSTLIKIKNAEEQELIELYNYIINLERKNRELLDLYTSEKNIKDDYKYILRELERELNKDFDTYLHKDKTMRETGKTYKAGANNYRSHIYLKLKELKEVVDSEYIETKCKEIDKNTDFWVRNCDYEK